MRRCVAVVGPDQAATGANREAARLAGQWLAAHDVLVLTGGLGGVMASAAEGVADAGGMSIGLLPGHDRTLGDPSLTIALPTGLGELRNGLLVRSAEVVLAIGGSWGTLSEIALAVRTGVPVVSLDGWDLPESTLVVASSLDEALTAVWSLLA